MSRKKYDANSEFAKIGKSGEQRLYDIFSKFSPEFFYIRKGLEHPAANGKMGDLLFSASEFDSPEIGIEIKTSTAKYPNSVCISEFEIKHSVAKYLAACNEDESAGWTFMLMQDAKDAALNRGEYYTVDFSSVERIRFNDLLQSIKSHFSKSEIPKQDTFGLCPDCKNDWAICHCDDEKNSFK